jgi:hypothetical protein
MTSYLKHVLLAGVLAGSVVGQTECKTLPALGAALCGDALIAAALLAIFQNNPNLTYNLPPSFYATGFQFSPYVGVAVVPGIALALGGRLHMLKKAEGVSGKIRALVAIVGSLIGSIGVLVGAGGAQFASEQQNKGILMSAKDIGWCAANKVKFPLFEPMALEGVHLIGCGAGALGAALLAVSAFITP